MRLSLLFIVLFFCIPCFYAAQDTLARDVEEVIYDSEGTLEKMLNINLISAYDITRGLVHQMKDRKEGHIFNMCSTASIIPYVNGGSYCISKFAIYGMTKVLREEMKEFEDRIEYSSLVYGFQTLKIK